MSDSQLEVSPEAPANVDTGDEAHVEPEADVVPTLTEPEADVVPTLVEPIAEVELESVEPDRGIGSTTVEPEADAGPVPEEQDAVPVDALIETEKDKDIQVNADEDPGLEVVPNSGDVLVEETAVKEEQELVEGSDEVVGKDDGEEGSGESRIEEGDGEKTIQEDEEKGGETGDGEEIPSEAEEKEVEGEESDKQEGVGEGDDNVDGEGGKVTDSKTDEEGDEPVASPADADVESRQEGDVTETEPSGKLEQSEEVPAVEVHDSSMAIIEEEEESIEGSCPLPEEPAKPAEFVLRQAPEDEFNLEPEFDENELLHGIGDDSAQSFFMPAFETWDLAADDEEVEAPVMALPSMDKEVYYELCRFQQGERSALNRRNSVLQMKLKLHFKQRKGGGIAVNEETSPEQEAKYLRKITHFGAVQSELTEAQSHAAEVVGELETTNSRLEEELQALLDALIQLEREACADMVSPKTGNPLPERLVERLLRRQKEAFEATAMTRLTYIKARDRTHDLEQSILELEDLGQNLKIVDYEQLRMENQNLVDKIEERDEELARFRSRAMHSAQALTHYREKWISVRDAMERQEERLSQNQETLDHARTELNTLKATRDKLRADYLRESAQAGLLTKPQLLRDFEETLDACDAQRAQLEDLRVELLHGKKQLEAMRENGQMSLDEFVPRMSIISSMKLHAQHRNNQLAARRPTRKDSDTFVF